MTIRRATEADCETLVAFWRAFEEEVPEHEALREGEEEARRDIARHVREGIALVAEDEGETTGMALVEVGRDAPGVAHLTDLYVVPEARRRGVGHALVAAVEDALGERGIGHLTLDVLLTNERARALYKRLGFADHTVFMLKPLAAREAGPSFGSVHVQTDDRDRVERAVSQYVPRLGRSAETVVSQPRNGWVAVYDDLCDREPKLLRRLARELSDRLGAVVLLLGVEEGAVVRYVLFDRGSVTDEYASVPEWYGPLPPGDVIALGANPTVAHRLTGADPARLKAVARIAASPEDLAPAGELYAELAAVLGVEGGDRGSPGG